MLFITVCLVWAACVFAAPAPTDVVPLEKHQPTVIPIISQSEELEPNGTYKFSYETGNGIKREEISYDKVLPKAEGRSAGDSNEGGESDESNEIHVQQGSYSYTAPDGTIISLRYIADENGFQPIGDHIPRVPTSVQYTASSAEKSGRALKVPDSAGAGSAPVTAAKLVASEALTQAAPEEKKPAEGASVAAPAPAQVGAATKVTEAPAEALTTEAAKVPEKSTESEAASTEAASTEAASTEAASTEAASTEASTVAASTESASTEAASTEAASTEAASTEVAKSGTPAETPTTEAVKVTEVAESASTTESAKSGATEAVTTTASSAEAKTEAGSPTTASA